ncbi:MAG: DegV family protein [Clostridiales bacterium]|nr:DegV family protein [Clostridiales bacterium]
MVNFVVDSTFGITREYAQKHGIKVASLTLGLGEKEYVEGYREDWDAFYSDYSKGKLAAKSSQPSPEKFIDAINEAYADDPDGEVIIFTIGDRLSGTIGSANIAVASFPDRRIAAIDSHNGGVSSYMFLQEMIKARDGGASFDEIVELAIGIRDRISTRFIPASLTELARGGRVNKLLSRIGNLLNIKPVFEYRANELTVLSKCLGVKRAMQAAIETLPEFDRIAILYIYSDELVDQLKERLIKKFEMSDVDVEPMCPVAGAHIGIGTVGIVTLASEKKSE